MVPLIPHTVSMRPGLAPVVGAHPRMRGSITMGPTACWRCHAPRIALEAHPRAFGKRYLCAPAATDQSRQTDGAESATDVGTARDPVPGFQVQQQDSGGVKLALGMIKFYKTAISPLLPPACRYVPTCSVYAAEAYQRYGGAKGTVLTAWRLLRCNPFGSSGLDLVTWPPPGLEWLGSAASD